MEENGLHVHINAGDLEHIGAMCVGTSLIAMGVPRRKSAVGVALCALGAAAILRGLYGYKRVYKLLGKDLPGGRVTLPKRAPKIEKSIVIDRTPDELYNFWRKFENLPQVMGHVLAVQVTGAFRSHWVAKAPAGMIVEWDAEIINDIPNELIAWQSLEGSDVDNAGSIHFEPHPSGGTKVTIVMRYTPPGDIIGIKVARLFGADPEKEVEEDLQRFKQRMEVESLT